MWKPVVMPKKKWVEQKKAQKSDDQTDDPEKICTCVEGSS